MPLRGVTSPQRTPVGVAAVGVLALSLLAGCAPAFGSPITLAATPTGWQPVTGPLAVEPRRTPDADRLAPLHGTVLETVVDAVLGDLDGDGSDEIVVVFTRPARPTLVGATLRTPVPTDDHGRTLHVGVFDAQLRQVWVAGTVLAPISRVAVCDGALVIGYSSRVGGSDLVAVGVLHWQGHGFTASPNLPDLAGAGRPACADVDGDHRPDPVVLEASS